MTTKERTGIHTLPPFCPPSLLYPLATGMQPASYVSNGNRVPSVTAEAYTVIPPLPPSPGRLFSVFLQHSACHLSDFEYDPRAHKEINNKLRPRFAAWPWIASPAQSTCQLQYCLSTVLRKRCSLGYFSKAILLLLNNNNLTSQQTREGIGDDAQVGLLNPGHALLFRVCWQKVNRCLPNFG